MKRRILLTVLLVSVGLAFTNAAAGQGAGEHALDSQATNVLAHRAQGPAAGLISTLRRNLDLTTPPASKPDASYLATLQLGNSPSGNWGGDHCPKTMDLRSLVDNFLATPNPNYPGLGSTIPGASVSWSSPACGTFDYAAGLSNVEQNRRMTPATLMGIASMTKAIIAALTLRLSESGAFGAQGLGTTVNNLLTPKQIEDLTVGDNPSQPRCPGFAYLYNRDTGSVDWTAYSCPDLSRVTLRDLMRANHGMYDFLDEVLLPDEDSQYFEGVYFDLFQYLGLDPMPPVSSKSGFDYLRAYGLKQNDSAVVGGANVRDFEVSFGNTGFQLLGVILEQRTGNTLDELIQALIVKPLGLDTIEVYVDPTKRSNLIADGYEIWTGEPLIEQTGIYPIANLHGHTAVNTLSLGLGQPGNIDLAGGAGGLIANPKSYLVFLEAFVNGGLLGPVAQRELDSSFLLIPEYSSSQDTILNGFGLVKQQLRQIPGYPDVDLIAHDGSLPGVTCTDGVLYAPDSQLLWGTGVICQNSNLNAFPDQFDLFVEFLNKISAVPAQPHK